MRHKELNLGCKQLTKVMRGNTLIDYSQLGLDYRLQSHSISVNSAFCLFQLKRPEEAVFRLVACSNTEWSSGNKSEEFTVAIVSCILYPVSGTDWKDQIQIEQVPLGRIFEPSQDKMKNTNRVNFMGNERILVECSIDKSKNSDRETISETDKRQSANSKPVNPGGLAVLGHLEGLQSSVILHVEDCSFDSLVQVACKALSLTVESAHKTRFKYIDDAGDFIVVSDQQDFELMVGGSKKLEIWISVEE
jgi:hypothetical protein